MVFSVLILRMLLKFAGIEGITVLIALSSIRSGLTKVGCTVAIFSRRYQLSRINLRCLIQNQIYYLKYYHIIAYNHVNYQIR